MPRRVCLIGCYSGRPPPFQRLKVPKRESPSERGSQQICPPLYIWGQALGTLVAERILPIGKVFFGRHFVWGIE
jgi:hypothetical protein